MTGVQTCALPICDSYVNGTFYKVFPCFNFIKRLYDKVHLVHKVNVSLLKLNVATFGGEVSQPLILKRKDLILTFGFRDWEGEKSLSSYKIEHRVVCNTS